MLIQINKDGNILIMKVGTNRLAMKNYIVLDANNYFSITERPTYRINLLRKFHWKNISDRICLIKGENYISLIAVKPTDRWTESQPKWVIN